MPVMHDISLHGEHAAALESGEARGGDLPLHEAHVARI